MAVKAIISITILSVSLIGCTTRAKNNLDTQKVDNIITLAKIYGIVKYFHPSDEAYDLNWDKFAIYSAEKILECETQEQFSQVLDSLFSPIMPISKLDTPIKKGTFSEIFWYHQGVGFRMINDTGAYYSERIKIDKTNDTIYGRPHYGDTVSVELGKGRVFSIPIVLLQGEDGTLPQSDSNEIELLNQELDSFMIDEAGLAFRLGNVINIYNVFQHFFPYFDVLSINWQQELRNAVVKSFKDSSKTEHIVTLRKFTAPLKDGHISIQAIGDKKNNFYPPISWKWIQNQLVITKVWKNDLNLKVGDKVIKINGQNSKDYFNELESRISAGTIGRLRHISEIESLQGQKNSKIIIQLDGKEVELIRSMRLHDQNKDFNPYTELENNIHYLNLHLLDWGTIEYLMPKLETSNGIIFDLRRYPNGPPRIINHLLKDKDTAKGWLRTPKIFYPNQKNIVNYVEGNWNEMMVPAQPYLGDRNVVFITNGGAISYAESIMGFVKGYNLATIVGQPTAGTNGNFNNFMLPGNIHIKWTGMKALKLDGTQLHGIGILPDVFVEETIEDIINGKDKYLEKALEVVNKKISANTTVDN